MRPGPIPFRRRTFYVKHGFQSRFALYPIALFALFIVGAGLYLGSYLHEAIEFQLYLPHSRLQNPWDLIAPALARTAAWGGGGFLAALGIWGATRFARLKADLNGLADWMTRLTTQKTSETAPPISDREVRALGEGLHRAVVSFEAWDREVSEKTRVLAEAVDSLDRLDPARGVPSVRVAWKELWEALGAVKIDEELS